jgi:hypothetical protein
LNDKPGATRFYVYKRARIGVFSVNMKSTIGWMREQAARLFELAADARKNGNFNLSELLTAAALRCLDRVTEAEADEATSGSFRVSRMEHPALK